MSLYIGNTMATTVNKIVEEFDELPLEDKEYVKEVFDKLLIEARREELGRRAEEAMASYESGKSKVGSVSDLMKDLND